MNIEQPENLKYRAARQVNICSSPKTCNIEQPEKLDIERREKWTYRAARKRWISSSPKSLNIDQPEKFEYRAARQLWISSSLKSLHIEQPTNFEDLVARKLWISISPKSLNIERPEKFSYRAIGPPCCKTSFYGKQLPTKRWQIIAKAQNQHWRYHPQVCFAGVTCPLPTSLRITLKEEGSAAVAEASK